MSFISTLGRSVIQLGGGAPLAWGAQVRGLGKGWLWHAWLPKVAQEAGGLRALCPGCQRVEECGSEECLTQAEIARFAALFWALVFSIGCHRSLTPGWGHSCPGHPQLWPFGDSDLIFQISLIIIIIFIFNQELLWEPENGLDLEAHTQALTSSALLLPLSLLVVGASVGGGRTWSHEVCVLCCLLWGTAAQGFPSPKTSFEFFSLLPAGMSAQPSPAELRSSL